MNSSGENLKEELGQLRASMVKLPEADGYLRLFDDFLEHHEFGLALVMVCDYLLEPAVPQTDAATIEKIHLLQVGLGIEDDYVERLQTKASLRDSR
jgi:hypothetical protein